MTNPHRALLFLLLGACAGPRGTPAPGPAPDPLTGRLPPIPARSGPLAIEVVYPGEGQTLGVRDSTFVFGNVGTGGATLAINGAPVEVAPNGAFLAFLPVPPDGRYQATATAGAQTASATRTVQVRAPSVPAADAPPPTPSLPAADRAAALRPAVAASSRADGTVIGTALPGSGTPYHWFFPNSTRLAISGQLGDQYRVRLTDQLSVWVDTAEVDLLPEGPVPRGFVSTVAARPERDWVDIRLATSSRLPFRVDGAERGLTVTVYGAGTRTNIMLYGEDDPFIRRMEWEQPADDLYQLHVELDQPLWGFLPFWNADGQLVVRVRRPPPIVPAEPLRGVYIGVDAGHPPGGAIGPTRFTEAEANLAIARRLVALLRERGARVLEIRPDTTAVDLGARPRMAIDSGVHLLVSVHNDAFADGVNPFENAGTHVFYNQPQSLDLARAIQRELLRELGLRDLGVSRRDLALVRPTWMPAVLTESTFMMVPRHEAALRDPETRERIARAHLRGIEGFLRARAGGGTR